MRILQKVTFQIVSYQVNSLIISNIDDNAEEAFHHEVYVICLYSSFVWKNSKIKGKFLKSKTLKIQIKLWDMNLWNKNFGFCQNSLPPLWLISKVYVFCKASLQSGYHSKWHWSMVLFSATTNGSRNYNFKKIWDKLN